MEWKIFFAVPLTSWVPGDNENLSARGCDSRPILLCLWVIKVPLPEKLLFSWTWNPVNWERCTLEALYMNDANYDREDLCLQEIWNMWSLQRSTISVWIFSNCLKLFPCWWDWHLSEDTANCIAKSPTKVLGFADLNVLCLTRWVEGELWHLSRHNAVLAGQPAEIGFLVGLCFHALGPSLAHNLVFALLFQSPK